MKIFHLSDLHLGKRVCSMPLTDDQKHILDQITEHVRAEKPDAVIIAGDVYDRSLPPEEAVRLFDDFLYELSALDTKVLMISGNHDSAERLAFGGRIMNKSGIYISPDFDGSVTPVTLSDAYGEVCFYLLPFITPAGVRRFFEGERIESCTDAARAVISRMELDPEKRSVLIAHQFVSGAERTKDSETVFVGSTDNVDAEVFEPFDYVALGHLHRPQSVGKKTVRYCGTPLKYSFSASEGDKSITVAELAGKGDISIREIPLEPLRDWLVKEGKFEDIMREGCGDFVKAVLTDETEIYDAVNKLRSCFPNLLQLEYKRAGGSSSYDFAEVEAVRAASPAELFGEFFRQQNGGREMNERQKDIVSEIFGELAGGNNETDQT